MESSPKTIFDNEISHSNKVRHARSFGKYKVTVKAASKLTRPLLVVLPIYTTKINLRGLVNFLSNLLQYLKYFYREEF